MTGWAPASWRGRLGVIGIGLGGASDLTAGARRRLEAAEVVIGTARHLALLRPAGDRALEWDGKLDSLEARLAGRDGARTVVLASGDPNLFGLGSTLTRRHGASAVEIEPAVSSLQLALARAGIPAAGAALLSAHGRSLAGAVGPALASRRAAILTDPEHDPEALCRALLEAGMEAEARVVVAACLGLGEEETIREGTLAAPPPPPYDPLSVVVLDRPAGSGPGLGRLEVEYEHEAGMVTKAEVRAIALAALDLAPDDVVWDLGSGSGSVAIEAGRLAHRGAVYAVERDPGRAGQLRHNLARHGSWNVEAIMAPAETTIAGLPTPDAVFLGGDVAALLEPSVTALQGRRAGPPGRLAANLATVDSVQEAVAACRRLELSWRLAQVQISRARPLAGRIGWEALNPVHVLAAEVSRR